MLVLRARRSCLVCPVPGFYWVNEKGRVTEWRSEDCPSACSFHYVPYIHAISFIDGSSQVQQKQMTAELESEPTCLELSVSKMRFRGNNVLHRHHHQKITRDTHGKGATLSSGHWIKSCQLLREAQQLCIKQSPRAKFPSLSLTHSRITLPLWGTAAPGTGALRRWGKQQRCAVPPLLLDLPPHF